MTSWVDDGYAEVHVHQHKGIGCYAAMPTIFFDDQLALLDPESSPQQHWNEASLLLRSPGSPPKLSWIIQTLLPCVSFFFWFKIHIFLPKKTPTEQLPGLVLCTPGLCCAFFPVLLGLWDAETRPFSGKVWNSTGVQWESNLRKATHQNNRKGYKSLTILLFCVWFFFLLLCRWKTRGCVSWKMGLLIDGP